MILAQDTFLLSCALLTGLAAAYWVIIDSLRLRAALRDDRASPATRDKIFGSTIGILVALIGVIGIVKYYVP